jgi:hypothetical protein
MRRQTAHSRPTACSRQVIRRRVIVRTLSEPVIAAKMASANTFHHDDMLSRLKLASRTSSMQ